MWRNLFKPPLWQSFLFLKSSSVNENELTAAFNKDVLFIAVSM